MNKIINIMSFRLNASKKYLNRRKKNKLLPPTENDSFPVLQQILQFPKPLITIILPYHQPTHLLLISWNLRNFSETNSLFMDSFFFFSKPFLNDSTICIHEIFGSWGEEIINKDFSTYLSNKYCLTVTVIIVLYQWQACK